MRLLSGAAGAGATADVLGSDEFIAGGARHGLVQRRPADVVNQEGRWTVRGVPTVPPVHEGYQGRVRSAPLAVSRYS